MNFSFSPRPHKGSEQVGDAVRDHLAAGAGAVKKNGRDRRAGLNLQAVSPLGSLLPELLQQKFLNAALKDNPKASATRQN